MNNILTEIIEKRRADIEKLGPDFGIQLPKKRNRPVHPFLKDRSVILEVKRASPSKGDISPNLDSYQTALSYSKSGAGAVSCLTEQNYFKGSLSDLMNVCLAVDDFESETHSPAPAVLRKDFLLSADEIEISYRAGADAVLLIARILDTETFLEMARAVEKFKMSALIEIRGEDDLDKLKFVMGKVNGKKFVCGVNSRNLSNFKIDLLRPCMMIEKIKSIMGDNAKIIFESGVTKCECAKAVGSLGFSGLLLGEAAAKNPSIRKSLVESFMGAKLNRNAEFWKNYAKSVDGIPKIKICGITRIEDAVLANNLGASFLGFIFSSAFPRSVSHDGRLKKLLPGLKILKTKKVAVITEMESEENKTAVQLVKDGAFDVLQFHNIPYEKIPDEILELPHYFAVKSMAEYVSLFERGEMRILLDLHCSGGISDKDLDICENNAACCDTSSMWVAGGINAMNICDVHKKLRCELIDVSSGIENDGEIGIKDEEKMHNLFLLTEGLFRAKL